MIDAVQQWNHDRLSNLVDWGQRQGGFELGRFCSHPDDVYGPVEQGHTRELILEIPQDSTFDRQPARISRKRLWSQ